MKRVVLIFTLLVLIASSLAAEKIALGSGTNGISVISSSASETVLQYQISSFEKNRVDIEGSAWYQIRLPKEGITQDKGFPELPVFNRSIAIDNSARMKLEIFDIQYQDLEIAVAPSKGVITRNVDPATVPYTFGAIYQSRDFYPQKIGELSEPYILRDIRGITVKTSPFAYNPSTQTLRVYTGYKIRIYSDGQDTVNTLATSRSSLSREFSPVYENHFINWNSYRYTPVSDSYGKLLVICHTNYMSTILPYVNWKIQKGIPTELVQWSTIGTTAAQLQTYIQTRYNADNTIAFVQIVGDAPQIPSLTSGGGGSDPTFALVAGGDNYPDIFIGRFSAETAAQVTAQINKAIVYERDATSSDTWLSRAIGIASAEGGGGMGDNGESDIAHMNNIRTDLLGYGFTSVDQVYDPGASASTVSTNVNAGRGFINYVGHGSDTSWSTTGFSNTNATALTNGNKTPFIMDVACVNGNFVSITCFAEAWLRNANGGAVAMYASSINQSWNSPMRAQDEVTDLILAESKTTVGGLYYNGSCKMMDIYGNTTGSDGVNMYKTWHIFGDASLLARTKTPLAMTVTHPSNITSGTTSINVSTGVANTLVAITNNNTIYGRAFTNSSGNATITLTSPPTGVVNYTITATAFNRVTYIGTIAQTVASGPWMEVTAAIWDDANNDIPEYNESGYLDVTFANSGTSTATSVTATLSCATAGITITDAIESIASLAAGGTTSINNAFAFNIANNIVNSTSAAFTITMVSGANSWVHNFNLTLYAPALAFGTMTISDPAPGNNNGRLDPGETVTITMPLSNTGGAASLPGSATLTCGTTGITVNTGTATFTAINAAGTASLSFSLTAASGMTVGTVASFNFAANAGAYTASKVESVPVGLITETFETGNFASYPWIQGTYPWVIVNTGAHAGTYAAKSGTITHSQSSTMETTRILSSPGTITFWYKVSSESGYDFLKFYIDGSLQNQWAGTVDWTQASYTLAAGTRVLKWEYMKDGSVSTDPDCAWVDDIIFPASTAPNSFYPPQNLTAAPGNGFVNLSWQAPLTGTPTGYRIYRNSALLTTVTDLSYTDNAVVNETSYAYYLVAAYSGGTSDPTATVTATPTAIVPTSIILGTGTTASGTSEACPINIYYDSLHGQAVYTKAELNTAGVYGPINITQIGFYVSSVPNLALPNFLVRMKHTTEANVANWQTATNMVTVYSSASYMPVAGGFDMLTLSTPFIWNGNDNIVIDTAFSPVTTWSSSGTTRYSTVTSGYRYIRVDDSDQTSVFAGGYTSTYRPNVRLTLLPNSSGPIIAASPSALSYGEVAVGSSSVQQFTIQNTGDQALTGTITTPSSVFTVAEVLREQDFALAPSKDLRNSISFSVSAGATKTYNLTFTPTSASTYSGNVVISSNAANSPTVNISVSGTGVQMPVDPRYVAEWEPAVGAIVRYPFGLPYTIMADISQETMLYVVVASSSQSACASALSSNGVNMSHVAYINATTDTYWIRDYGPWYIFENGTDLKIVDFTYNRPRPNDDVIPVTIASYFGMDYYTMELTATGGNVMTDGNGKAMSTDLILEENPTLSQAQIEQMFVDYLGVTEYQHYADPNNTYIDHIDCWGKLLDVDKVLIRSVPSSHAQYSAIQATVAEWQSKTSSYGTPYQIFRVYTPNDEPYSNSFILNKHIYVPQMGTANDAAALATYQSAMPGYTVTGYTYSTWESTDAIHCRINTIFDEQMIHLWHMPLTTAMANSTVSINVEITHTNALNPALTHIAYKHSSSGTWQYAPVTYVSGNNWTASVPTPAFGQTLYYYILGTDTTARNTTMPLCGASDPFELLIDQQGINNPPSIVLPNSFSYDMNGSLVVDFSPFVDDIDEDALTLAYSGNTNVLVSINGLSVTFTASPDWFGSESLTFTVSDGTDVASDGADVIVNLNYLAAPVISLSQPDPETVKVEWTAVSNALSYEVWVSSEPFGAYSFLASTANLYWNDMDLSPMMRFYKVLATDTPLLTK